MSAPRRFLLRALAPLLPGPLTPPLEAARRHLNLRLAQAFRLASAQQRAVRIPADPETSEDHLSIHLPPGVAWGRPIDIPPPPDLEDSAWTSAPPHALTVLPRRRAASNVWFLHHGRSALCLRLGLRGQVEFLGYHPLLGTWREA
ncbi:MAG TPA: hypothetical protein VF768_09765 [Holophagaceae bacterium]